MIRIKILFLYILHILPFIAHAQICDKPESPEPVRIYFVNGMNNTFLSEKKVDDQFSEQDMIESKEALRRLVGLNIASYGNSFNFKEDHYTQLKQVAQQRATQPTQYWQWMSQMLSPTGRFTAVPQWLFEASFNSEVNYAKELRAKQYFIDKDLQSMVAQYLLDLQSGKKVVLVAHSQGNFYANNAYIYIRNNYPQYSNSIGIVMVASPASFNASGGPHTNNDKDLILQTVKLLYPILSYTGSFNQPNDVLDHNFNTVYLADWGNGKGKFEIKQNVLNMINALQAPTKHIDCAADAEIPVQIATWTATNVTTTTATMNGYLTSGRNVFVWFNWKVGSNIVPACSSNQSVYPGGTHTVGVKNRDLYNIPSNTNVYYRACAIGAGNQISEGLVVSFQTLAPPPPAQTTRDIQVCTSRGLSLADNPVLNPITAYQVIGAAVNGSAFGSYGIAPHDISFYCRTARVKTNFTNSFVFYLTTTNEYDAINRSYSFGFYELNGQYINRPSCVASWTLQNRTSATCYVAF